MTTVAADQLAPAQLSPGERFINRELSWIAFDARVLDEAENSRHPLLERVRFLAISDSNLDEFFMVRVAGLQAQLDAGLDRLSDDGMTVRQQLDAIDVATRALYERQQRVWRKLHGELTMADVHILTADELTADERAWLEVHFTEQIFPVLTPLAIDPAHPFPQLPNDGLALVVKTRRSGDEEDSYTLIPLSPLLGRFINVGGEGRRYLPLDEAVPLFLPKLLPNFTILHSSILHVLRASELEILEEGFENLVEMFKLALKQRRRGHVIRVIVHESMPAEMSDFVALTMQVPSTAMWRMGGLLNHSDLTQLITDDRPELRFSRYVARSPERIRDYRGDCLAAIRSKDIVVHHPYETFDVVLQFLRQAARDPDVLAIKQTLYRTSSDSPIVRALIEAAEAGKSVTAVVELKARFDEEANIRLAHDLERAGAQVVYGFVSLKTHAKMSMVVRREDGRLRTYVHLGTGNYHPVTARIYTDLSYFTCDPALGRDVSLVFNYLTGYALPQHLGKLRIAPLNLDQKLYELIEREAEHARAGRPAQIWAKMNALVEPPMIDALYAASQAGVRIELVVRGVCCLRPGVPGLSDNICVKSVVGRFLEHSRIICFANGHALPSDEALVFISSADWMPRNFHKRVETLVPIQNPTVHAQILDQIMIATLKDNVQSWKLQPSGEYVRVHPDGEEAFCAHDYFMNNPSLSGRGRAMRRGKKAPRLQLAEDTARNKKR
jgi:polyphosphate kinase